MKGVHVWNNSQGQTRTVHLVFTPKYRGNAFESREAATAILQILGEIAKRHKIVLYEASAMPDHVHILVSFDCHRSLEMDIVKKLKGASAREFLKRFKDYSGSLWGVDKHYEDIKNSEQFDVTLRYIQRNPEQGRVDPDGRILSELRKEYLRQSTNKFVEKGKQLTRQ